jgi:phosphate transport system substrate-binding protein
MGVITKWNDPALQPLNPGRNLPNAKIQVFYQSEPSSDSYLLSDYLSAEDGSQFGAYLAAIGASAGSEPAPVWPAPAPGVAPAGFPNWGTGNMHAVSSPEAALQGPAHTADSISFALGQMRPHRVGPALAYVLDAAGDVAGAKPANVATALSSLSTSDVLDDNLVPAFGSTQPFAYPLSTFSYFVTPCSPSLAANESPPSTCSGNNSGSSSFSSTQGAELGQFIDYVACAGQTTMNQLGFGALPPALVQVDLADIGAINDATEPAGC